MDGNIFKYKNDKSLDLDITIQQETPPTEIILEPSTSSDANPTRRRIIITSSSADIGDNDSNVVVEEAEERRNHETNSKKRRAFNVCKHIVSIIFVVLDISFDWITYSEMSTGNFTISVEKQVRNIQFTHECEVKGNTVKTLYIVITVVSTILSMVQTVFIVYQIQGEIKNIKIIKSSIQ